MRKKNNNNELLSGVQLNFPDARNWMWTYCVYLGSTLHNGRYYDLGIYISPIPPHKPSAAIVFGNTPGDYLSGELEAFKSSPLHAMVQERAKYLGLI